MITTPQAALDEARFWLGQDAEHNTFFALGLVDPALKAEAVALASAYQSALQAGAIQQALSEILPRAQAFKATLLKRLASGEWLGWIYPAFIQHAADEMTYLQMRLMPVSSPMAIRARETLRTIAKFNSEEAALNAHLLDPSYDPVPSSPVNQARAIAAQAYNLHAQGANEPYPNLLNQTFASTQAFEQWLAQNDVRTLKSIIPAALAAHALRERRWFLNTIASLPRAEQTMTGMPLEGWSPPPPSPSPMTYPPITTTPAPMPMEPASPVVTSPVPEIQYATPLTASQIEESLSRIANPAEAWAFQAYDRQGQLHSFLARSWPVRNYGVTPAGVPYGVIDGTRLDTGEQSNVVIAPEA